MAWKQLFLVAAGGGIGAMARFLGQRYLSGNFNHPFPWGTFAVNCLGCLLIGLLYGWSVKTNSLSPEWRLLLMTGFCGGFTTFSAFTLEGMALLQTDRIALFFLYFSSSIVLGLGATALGYWIAR